MHEQARLIFERYYKGNVWPKDVPELEEFESTFKASVLIVIYGLGVWPDKIRLGRLIYDVGISLSRACEPFGMSPLLAIGLEAEGVVASTGGTLLSIERLISESQSNKVRRFPYSIEP